MLVERLSRRTALKMLATAGLGIAAAPILASCQPTQPDTAAVVEPGVVPAGDVPEIRFMTRTGPLGLFMKEFARLHQEKREGEVFIKIEEGSGDDVGMRLLTHAAAGTAPDVFWQFYMLTPFNMHNEIMLPLADYAADYDTSIWFDWALELMSWNGELMGLPLGVMTGYNVIIYNRDLLNQAGVPEPDGPSNTWADLIEIAKGIKENTGKWGIDVGHWWWATETVVRNFGSNIVGLFG